NGKVFEFYAPLRRAREFIEKNYAEDLSLSDVARVAGLERKYFSTYFHAKVGVPFRYWLSWIRVREAMRLMSTNDESLTEIAVNVGFQDMRTFERSFKRITGMTPRGARKLLLPEGPGAR